MWPIFGMIVGGLLFVGCTAWVLAKISRSNLEIEESHQRYILPRHLTEDQIATISDYLKQYESQTVNLTVLKNSGEASLYRADIQRALKLGGWCVSKITYSNDLREGITTHFEETEESRNRTPNPKHPKANQLFQQAFKRAGVEISGGGSGSAPGIETNEFTISIGCRRMDDSDLLARRRREEEARKLLKGKA